MEQLSPCIAVTCCLQTRYIYLPKLRTLTLLAINYWFTTHT
jgi:hypothetical protein